MRKVTRRGARRDRWRSRKGLAVVLAAMLIGGGAAFAATDPLGWWSANQARQGTGPIRIARTHANDPTDQLPSAIGRPFRCTASHSGQRYSLLDAIRPPVALTRAKLTAAIAPALAAGKISTEKAARFRAELAAVPDSFFHKFEFASRFGTYGGVDIRQRTNVRAAPRRPCVPGLSERRIRTALSRSQRRYRRADRRWRVRRTTGRGLAARDSTATAELQPPARHHLHPGRVPAPHRHGSKRDHEQLVIQWRPDPDKSQPAAKTARPSMIARPNSRPRSGLTLGRSGVSGVRRRRWMSHRRTP